MGPLTDGDYGNNYSNTIYGNVSPNIVGFGAGNSSDSSSDSSSFGISFDPMSLVSNGFNAVSQLLTNHFNRKFAAQQAKLQNQWNIDQWNRENAYNTPAAQMQRFIQAGLNPNLLVNGQQSLAASSPNMESAKDAPAGVAPQIDPSAALVRAQVRNLDAQTSNLESQTSLNTQNIELIKSQLNLNENQAELILAHTAVTWRSIEEMMTRIDLNKTELDQKGLSLSMFRDNYNSIRQSMAARNALDVYKANSFYKIQDLSIALMRAEANQANANASQAKANAAYLKQLEDRVAQLTPEEKKYYDQMSSYYRNLASKTATEDEYQKLLVETYKIYGNRKMKAEVESKERENHTFLWNLTTDVGGILNAPINYYGYGIPYGYGF